MKLYKIELTVKGWLPNRVIEWVKAQNQLEALNKLKNESIYKNQTYIITQITEA